MIITEGLAKQFGHRQVLKDLHLNLSSSKITALIGHNGSGKTTLLKCILGLVRPTRGSILFDEHDVANAVEYRRGIGYMPQITHFPENLSARELVKMITDLRGQSPSRLEFLIEYFSFEGELDQALRYMSGGTRQKVNAIIALMFGPPFMALDEPTAGLDPLASKLLKDLLITERDAGKTILITSHNTHELEEISDEILYLFDGGILFHGSVADLKRQTRQDNLERAIAHLMSQS